MNPPATARVRVPTETRSSASCNAAEAVECTGVAEPTDEMLMARIQQDDQEALGHLFRRYARRVRSVAARILRDAAEAEDLLQDLFLFIRRKAPIFDVSKSSAGSWVVQMAYQRAIERRRYLVTRQFYVRGEFHGKAEEAVGRPTVEDDYSPEAVFDRNGLGKVLDRLSEEQRETLRLYFFEGHTFQEIGEKLGQPIGNVRHHYYRGLDKLRREMFRQNPRKGLNGMANQSGNKRVEE
jgi:RNA polymerase sigma-70 factor (ECF subfamily)